MERVLCSGDVVRFTLGFPVWNRAPDAAVWLSTHGPHDRLADQPGRMVRQVNALAALLRLCSRADSDCMHRSWFSLNPCPLRNAGGGGLAIV